MKKVYTKPTMCSIAVESTTILAESVLVSSEYYTIEQYAKYDEISLSE